MIEFAAKRYAAAIPLFERALPRKRTGDTAYYAAYQLAESLVAVGKKLRGAARADIDRRVVAAYTFASKAHLGFAAAHGVAKKLAAAKRSSHD